MTSHKPSDASTRKRTFLYAELPMRMILGIFEVVFQEIQWGPLEHTRPPTTCLWRKSFSYLYFGVPNGSVPGACWNFLRGWHFFVCDKCPVKAAGVGWCFFGGHCIIHLNCAPCVEQMIHSYPTFNHQKFQVPKIEVLTYISCMDTADTVTESPSPKNFLIRKPGNPPFRRFRYLKLLVILPENFHPRKSLGVCGFPIWRLHICFKWVGSNRWWILKFFQYKEFRIKHWLPVFQWQFERFSAWDPHT